MRRIWAVLAAAGLAGASAWGMPRPVTGAPSGGLTVVLLLDVTASMTLVGLSTDPRVESVLGALGERLEPGDRIRIGRLGATVAFAPEFASDADGIRRAAALLDAPDSDRYGPSPIWDAIDAAVHVLAPEPEPRAVIVWTDGYASGNRLGRQEVAARARAAGVSVNVVSSSREMTIRQSPQTAAVIRPGVYLEWIARQTGGVYLSEERSRLPRSFGEAGRPIRVILDILRARMPRPQAGDADFNPGSRLPNSVEWPR